MLAVFAAGCSSTSEKPELPYPAFVQTDELADIFMAALPGVRAKEYSLDMRTRTTSNRVDLPADWSGTTGAEPGKALEIYVISGQLEVSDIPLGAGGYLYVPPGSLGFRLKTNVGARVLYFLDEVDMASMIRSPIIFDSQLVDWQPVSDEILEKELRKDPGSGARTWLLQVRPGASLAWESSSARREGYLLAGEYQHSECDIGISKTWQYQAGGYFRRPPGIVNGGPEAMAIAPAVWFLRETSEGTRKIVEVCAPPLPVPAE